MAQDTVLMPSVRITMTVEKYAIVKDTLQYVVKEAVIQFLHAIHQFFKMLIHARMEKLLEEVILLILGKKS